jgi:hypothetical protein
MLFVAVRAGCTAASGRGASPCFAVVVFIVVLKRQYNFDSFTLCHGPRVLRVGNQQVVFQGSALELGRSARCCWAGLTLMQQCNAEVNQPLIAAAQPATEYM